MDHRIDGQYVYIQAWRKYYLLSHAERVCIHKKFGQVYGLAAISDDQQLSAAQISAYLAIINCFLWFTLQYCFLFSYG